MLKIPALRWGEPYQSLETSRVVHFETGEVLAEVSQANGGIVQRDARQAPRAREVLCAMGPAALLRAVRAAADLYHTADQPLGDGTQSPADFVRCQAATTGLPEAMCRANMEKNRFVLENMDRVLDSLTRGLDLEIFARGHGVEARGVPLSYHAHSPVLGLVLPSNSPGVHTLWLPAIPLAIGLVLKPGPQEPWTPYRMAAAFLAAGVPKQAISVYPGEAEVGAAVLAACRRSLIFGGTATVERYHADPRVQVHGPGLSKILLGDDCVDDWEKYTDVMVESVFANSGRGCINCSGIWASRHTEEIAAAIARRLAETTPRPVDDPQAALAAFTVPGVAAAVSADIDRHTEHPESRDVTRELRGGDRLVSRPRCDYLLPTVLHCGSPQAAGANVEYMFPFVSVVRCPQQQMLSAIGQTLVGTAITRDEGWRRRLLESHLIDRLNIGPVPTTRLNWLQPHEGNLIDFLYRARAFQEVEVSS